jgi:hypothetical protein
MMAFNNNENIVLSKEVVIKTRITLIGLVLLGLSASLYASYPRAGYEAELSTLFHNVSGTATIVDANTIFVEHFNYDGNGPAVYFYLGTEDAQAAFVSGIPIGPLLTGTVYNDDEVVIHLTGSATLDGYNAISVWCVDFSANFGSGTFIDPDPAVAWVFDNNSIQSYLLDSFSPNDVPFGTIGDEDPNLLLFLGERYQVTVTNFVSHPFEVLAKGATSIDDSVLLSMKSGVDPNFESDSEIGWSDNGNGTVTFTLTQDLYDAMTVTSKRPGYRCGVHVANMRGDFDVCLTQPDGDLNGDCKEDFFDFDLFANSWLANNIAP